MAESLARQLAYLERNVEDDVLGNHVIRNARALVLGGRAVGDTRALERGLALLRRELPEQVLPDGGHYERSPVYHLVVLRDLLEVRVVSQADWLDEPIERMQRFAAGLQRPDGAPALFNDGTLDLAPQLDIPEPRLGCRCSKRPATRFSASRASGSPSTAARRHRRSCRRMRTRTRSRSSSGSTAAVVVDPGTSTYEPGADRDRCRSTAAHSTIAFDGRSQFEPWGAFRSGPLPAGPPARRRATGRRG